MLAIERAVVVDDDENDEAVIGIEKAITAGEHVASNTSVAKKILLIIFVIVVSAVMKVSNNGEYSVSE
jgi:hypothetical protein